MSETVEPAAVVAASAPTFLSKLKAFVVDAEHEAAEVALAAKHEAETLALAAEKNTSIWSLRPSQTLMRCWLACAPQPRRSKCPGYQS